MSSVENSIYTSGSESDNSLSSQSIDSDYIPSQTPETESYTSYESSEPPTPTESEYSSYSTLE